MMVRGDRINGTPVHYLIDSSTVVRYFFVVRSGGVGSINYLFLIV